MRHFTTSNRKWVADSPAGQLQCGVHPIGHEGVGRAALPARGRPLLVGHDEDGIPNGGGSFHGSNPTSNILLPIRTASSRSPPSPIPFPTPTFGPVMNPSSDMERLTVTLPMARR